MKGEPSEKTCDLCGLDCGRRPLLGCFDGVERSFCCMGCLKVYTILLESGVVQSGQALRETELFKRSLELGLVANSNGRRNKPAADLPPDAPTEEVLLHVSGLWCSSCAWLIEHALAAERGVVSAEAFFASDLVKVKYCPHYLPPERLVQRITELGYQARPYTGENETAQAEQRDLLLRMGVAGFLWLNIMTLSTALYVSFFEPIAESIRRYLPFLLMALATPVVFYSARPILQLAWRGLLNKVIRMETLLALGILAAYVYSAAQAVRGETHVYFDTAAAIVTLVLVGKLIERSAKEKTAQAITLLYRLMPKKARVLAGGRERFVSIDALDVGDVFVVKAGERIPADGVVMEGYTHVDESLLTGESVPVSKGPGSEVVSGSVNLGSVIHVRAIKVGNDTTLAQIVRLVEEAMSSRSSIERTVDRISRIFVPIVVLLAAVTLAGYWWLGASGVHEALMRAIAVLVIACPCALGIATPLAITTAIGAACRRGILVSDSRVLETIRNVDVVVLDKTGTVTEGQFALLHCEFISDADPAPIPSTYPECSDLGAGILQSAICNSQSAIGVLASLERYSEHPLGGALVKQAQQHGIELEEASQVHVRKGQGITGVVAGHRVFIGNRRLAEDMSGVLDARLERRASRWEQQGYTVAFFGWDAQLQGLLVFGDRLKPEAAQMVRALKQRGINVIVVSGDAQATTEYVARAIGADDFVAEALPEDKTDVIRKLQQSGSVVAMVGDGINDAPALAQANLGIALGSGTDIAMKAAAMVLITNSLHKILSAFDLAQRTWRVVRQNLFWAFLYNGLGISLAIAGILNPIMAAGAMLLSSLSVIGNSLRLSSPPAASNDFSRRLPLHSPAGSTISG